PRARLRLRGRSAGTKNARTRNQRTENLEPGTGNREPARASNSVPDPSRLQQAPLRDGDDAVPPATRTEGPRPRHVDDPARLVHDETERGVGDAADHLARVQQA